MDIIRVLKFGHSILALQPLRPLSAISFILIVAIKVHHFPNHTGSCYPSSLIPSFDRYHFVADIVVHDL